jgi:hypothetical protein
MPQVLDEIEDLEPNSSAGSPTLDEDLEAGSDAGEGDGATSSGAQDGDNSDDDLLAVARDVLGGKGGQETASQAEGEEDGQPADGNSRTEDDTYSDVPFNKHPRFQHLIRERDSYREDAGRYRNVQRFLHDTGLTDAEAADGLQIMALAKVNPQQCWEQIKPWVQDLLVAAGEVLPDDLRQRVQNGELTQEAAKEISVARAKASSFERQRAFDQRRQQDQRHSELQSSRQSAAQEWEDHRRARDPNFDAKLPHLQREVVFLQRTEGMPDTPQGVKEQLAKAYRRVNEQFKTAVSPTPQPKKPIRPVTGGQVSSSGSARPQQKPSTTKGVLANVLAKHGYATR